MTMPWVTDRNAALLTDLYELTMLQSYFEEGMNDTAVFDLYIRRLPHQRNYFVACGLEHVLHYLENFSFSPEAIEYLRSLQRFSGAFLDSLRGRRFTGDVYAVAEGTVVFANEPILEVIAPLPEAQIVETFVMNQIQVATVAASKAARVVYAAGGRSVVDFGLRRMQGADAGLKAPRAFYIAGVNSTSSVIAGLTYGVPVSGTMGHSYIQSFENEAQAFRSFLRVFPAAVLLIDTYDVLRATRIVIDLAREMGSEFRASGVRLDSGDLTPQAHEVRRMLDEAGLTGVKIFASNSLDEFEIERLVKSGVPIDGFGVGAHMAISSDAPVIDAVYKLAEYAGRSKMKLSASKSTLPGRKQIFRETVDGAAKRDIIGLAHENLGGDRLLLKVMENGVRVHPREPLDNARVRCQAQLGTLPRDLLSLSNAPKPYSVELSSALAGMRDEIAKSS